MIIRHQAVLRNVGVFLVVSVFASVAFAETLHLDGRVGQDSNPGTQEAPLRTIAEAAKRVSDSSKAGPATILIAPGRYDLSQYVLFAGGREFTNQARLTIRASILPDDPNWRPALMPTILSSERPEAGRAPSETYSLKVKTSHVTVEGLKFQGNALANNMHCCIERIGTDMDDLLVRQCMFMGTPGESNIYCATLATGDRFVVEHCVFSKCHACTVYWDGLAGIGGEGCGMRYCIVSGALISGVWTCQTAEDFEFHHNVVANSAYVWMRKPGDRQKYRIRDCEVVGNQHFSGYGVASGPSGQTGTEVTFDRDNIVTDGRLVFASEDCTHVAEASVGHDYGVGLFTKVPE